LTWGKKITKTFCAFEDWRELVQDRHRWQSVVMLVKSFKEKAFQKKKKKKFID
jgi:hypothetical protein